VMGKPKPLLLLHSVSMMQGGGVDFPPVSHSA
jgi:hypothetical protein